MNRLYGLDALRGVAALAVLFHHYEVIFGSTHYFSRAYLAVDVFFMISGYVMARTYEGRLGNSLSAVQFLWIRIKRLWPTMAVGTTIGAFLMVGKLAPVDFFLAYFLAI